MAEVHRFALQNQASMNLSNREGAIDEINDKLTAKLCEECKAKVIKIMEGFSNEKNNK
jgi:hypothetical protein